MVDGAVVADVLDGYVTREVFFRSMARQTEEIVYAALLVGGGTYFFMEGFDEGEIEMSVDEACTNVIRHAHGDARPVVARERDPRPGALVEGAEAGAVGAGFKLNRTWLPRSGVSVTSW